jgi:hypothetical protein
MAQHLVYNDGPDDFICQDGSLWPVGVGVVVDTLDPWLEPAIASGRLNDRGRPTTTQDDPPAELAKPKGTR